MGKKTARYQRKITLKLQDFLRAQAASSNDNSNPGPSREPLIQSQTGASGSRLDANPGIEPLESTGSEGNSPSQTPLVPSVSVGGRDADLLTRGEGEGNSPSQTPLISYPDTFPTPLRPEYVSAPESITAATEQQSAGEAFPPNSDFNPSNASLTPHTTPTTSTGLARLRASLRSSTAAQLGSTRLTLTVPPSSQVANPNLRLERDTSTTQKKRKGNKQPSSTSSKKQRTAASDALAIAVGGNSIRNVCMRRWNESQPGGRGRLADFNLYFNTLSDADKEPFKKEMCAIRSTTRKANAGNALNARTASAEVRITEASTEGV